MALNSLMVFAKVVEVNSSSEAARRLKMPVSTVSGRIAELEDQLGVRLLERSTRSLQLTDAGSEVREHAQHSAELSEAVDGIVSNHLSNVSGVLGISAPPSISDSLLAPLNLARSSTCPRVTAEDIGPHSSPSNQSLDSRGLTRRCRFSAFPNGMRCLQV
jgi:DNA-binding transcriptional LysR family regulator